MTGVKRAKCDREALQEQIIAVADEAFSKRGIKSVRMEDIAAMMSISKRTLYELFKDKEQLLFEVLCAQQKEMGAYLLEAASRADNVLEVVFAFYERKLRELGETNAAFLRDLRRYPRIVAYMKESRRKTDAAAADYFKKGVEQGIFRDDINFGIINEASYLQLDMLINSDLTDNYPLAEIYSEITILHMRGITTEKGQKMIDDFLHSMKKP